MHFISVRKRFNGVSSTFVVIDGEIDVSVDRTLLFGQKRRRLLEKRLKVGDVAVLRRQMSIFETDRDGADFRVSRPQNGVLSEPMNEPRIVEVNRGRGNRNGRIVRYENEFGRDIRQDFGKEWLRLIAFDEDDVAVFKSAIRPNFDPIVRTEE